MKAAWQADPSQALYTYRVSATGAAAPSHATATSDSHEGVWTVTVNERIGGNGKDSTPGDLLLGALAACQVLAVRATAAAMGISLSRLEVVAEGDVDHRGVMQFDPSIRAGFLAIRVRVRAEAPGVPPEKLAKLVAIAERSCAATDALRNPTPLTVALEPQ